MEIFLWLLPVVLLGFAAVVADGRFGELGAVVRDSPPIPARTGVLTAAQVRDARFAVVLRGYSMQQVDDLLDQVAAELESRETHPGE